MFYKFINSRTLEPAPKTFTAPDGRTFTNFLSLPASRLAEYGYFELFETSYPGDGKTYRPFYALETTTERTIIVQDWEEIILPPQPVRYDTKKAIEKMIANGLITAVREALIAQNMYEIMLLEPVLSMNDPRFVKVLEMVTPIAEAAGITDVSAWLEDCKV